MRIKLKLCGPTFTEVKKKTCERGDSVVISLRAASNSNNFMGHINFYPRGCRLHFDALIFQSAFFTIFFFLSSVPFGGEVCGHVRVSYHSYDISAKHHIAFTLMAMDEWMAEHRSTYSSKVNHVCGVHAFIQKQVNESSDDPNKRVFLSIFSQHNMKTKPFYHSPNAHSRRTRNNNAFRPSIRFGNLFVIKLTTMCRQQRKFFLRLCHGNEKKK